MHSFIAEVIADGRITIPKEIRKLLNLDLGDMVKVEVELVRKRNALDMGAEVGVEKAEEVPVG